MKKLLLSLLLCIFIGQVSYGQKVEIDLGELTKLKSFGDSVESLRKQLEKVKTELSSARTAVDDNKKASDDQVNKLTGELKTKNIDLEKLKEENKGLKSFETAKINLEKELKDEKEKLAKMNKKIEDANITEKRNKELLGENEKIPELRKQAAELLTTKAELEKVRAESSRLTGENTNLKTQIGEKDAEIKAFEPTQKQVNTLLGEKTNLTNQVNELGTQITTKEATIISLNQEKITLNNTLQPLQTGKTNLLAALKVSVDYVINSQDYNITKTQELINACETVKSLQADVNTWIANLNTYKELASAIEEGQKALAKAYSKENVNSTIQTLGKAKNFTPNQRKDLDSYKTLLADYCAINNKALKEIKDAQIYLPDDDKKAIAMLRKFLNQANIANYTYLVGEINKVINSPSMTNPIKASACN